MTKIHISGENGFDVEVILAGLLADGAPDLVAVLLGAHVLVAGLAHHHVSASLVDHAGLQVVAQFALLGVVVVAVLLLALHLLLLLLPLLRVVLALLRHRTPRVRALVHVLVQQPALAQMKLHQVLACRALLLAPKPELVILDVQRVVALAAVDEQKGCVTPTSLALPVGAAELITEVAVHAAAVGTHDELENPSAVPALLLLPVVEVLAEHRAAAPRAWDLEPSLLAMRTLDFLTDFWFVVGVGWLVAFRADDVYEGALALLAAVLVDALVGSLLGIKVDFPAAWAHDQLILLRAILAGGGLAHPVVLSVLDHQLLALRTGASEVVHLEMAVLAGDELAGFGLGGQLRVVQYIALDAVAQGPEHIATVLVAQIGHEGPARDLGPFGGTVAARADDLCVYLVCCLVVGSLHAMLMFVMSVNGDGVMFYQLGLVIVEMGVGVELGWRLLGEPIIQCYIESSGKSRRIARLSNKMK